MSSPELKTLHLAHTASDGGSTPPCEQQRMPDKCRSLQKMQPQFSCARGGRGGVVVQGWWQGRSLTVYLWSFPRMFSGHIMPSRAVRVSGLTPNAGHPAQGEPLVLVILSEGKRANVTHKLTSKVRETAHVKNWLRFPNYAPKLQGLLDTVVSHSPHRRWRQTLDIRTKLQSYLCQVCGQPLPCLGSSTNHFTNHTTAVVVQNSARRMHSTSTWCLVSTLSLGVAAKRVQPESILPAERKPCNPGLKPSPPPDPS